MQAPVPATEMHVWQARLDGGGWPDADELPSAERERAADMHRAEARRRWVASRWALRAVLGRYLARDPVDVELQAGKHGKPALPAPSSLRFNLSHSGELALIAVSGEREVGVDVQLVGDKAAGFYADWTRREAVAKCHGVGLGVPLPDAPVAVVALDAGAGFAAAIAVAGDAVPPLRHFVAEPG